MNISIRTFTYNNLLFFHCAQNIEQTNAETDWIEWSGSFQFSCFRCQCKQGITSDISFTSLNHMRNSSSIKQIKHGVRHYLYPLKYIYRNDSDSRAFSHFETFPNHFSAGDPFSLVCAFIVHLLFFAIFHYCFGNIT